MVRKPPERKAILICSLVIVKYVLSLLVAHTKKPSVHRQPPYDLSKTRMVMTRDAHSAART